MNKHIHPCVLMVANYPKNTGYAWWLMESFWKEISNQAISKEWDSLILYPNDSNNPKSNNKKNIIHSAFNNSNPLDFIKGLIEIKKNNIRSVYLTDKPYRNWKYLPLRVFGVRNIIVHDHTPGDRPNSVGLRGIAKLFLNLLPLITADKIIAISPLMLNRQIFNARIPKHKIALVTNGITPNDLDNNARNAIEKIYSINTDTFIITSVGRLNTYKRFEQTIKITQKLALLHPNDNFITMLVGDGPNKPDLELLSNKLTMKNFRAIFTGQVSNVWTILNASDAVIHPSLGEGLSLAILEAMAAAKPVLTPSLPSVCQTFEHNIDGLIFKEGNIDDAVDNLNNLYTNIDLRIAIGNNARQKILEKYNYNQTLDEFRESALSLLFK